MPAIPWQLLAALAAILGTRPSTGQATGQWRWSTGDSLRSRVGSAVATDPVRRRVVLFGGHTDHPTSSSLTDTWEWNGSRWIKVAESGPPPRVGAAMAYDEVSRRTILFGGMHPYLRTEHADTWAWDGVSWTKLSPQNSPSKRRNASVCSTSQGILLFGGGAYTNTKTWLWNGRDWVLQRSPKSPPPRWNAAMAFDRKRGEVVLYGGSPARNRDTWLWNAKGWRKSAGPPGPKFQGFASRAVFDHRHGELLLCVGHGQRHLITQLWRWNGQRWDHLLAKQAPPGSHAFALVNSPIDGSALFHVSGRGINELWCWSSPAWRQVFRLNQPPAAYSWAQRFVFDEKRDAFLTVVVNPDSGRMSLWQQRDNVWSNLDESGTVPPREGPGLAYHTELGKTLLFGGWHRRTGAHNDTWLWDGRSWQRSKSERRPPLHGIPDLVYQQHNGRILLGPSAPPGDTWEWDPKLGWIRHRLATSPRTFGSIAYDELRRRTVHFSPRDRGSVWEWDGRAWRHIRVSDRPPQTLGNEFVASVPGVGVVLYGAQDRLRRVLPSALRWNGQAWKPFPIAAASITPEGSSPHELVADRRRQRVRAFWPTGWLQPYDSYDLELDSLRGSNLAARLGDSFSLSAALPNNPGERLLILTALAGSPGVDLRPNAIGGRLPLAPDAALFATLRAGCHIGLDQQGRGTWTWRVPNLGILNGQTLHFAGVSVGKHGVGSITRRVKLTLTR